MSYIAIYQQAFIAKGRLDEIIQVIKDIEPPIEPVVIEESSCRRLEIDWHLSIAGIFANLPAGLLTDASSGPAKRGRPKLGVVSKEVTLLPRHWEWLASQRGGASVTLRRLVELAQRDAPIEDVICQKQQQLDKFMLDFLGDNPGFEEASRALYRNSLVGFKAAIERWPEEIQQFVLEKFSGIAKLHNGCE